MKTNTKEITARESIEDSVTKLEILVKRDLLNIKEVRKKCLDILIDLEDLE